MCLCTYQDSTFWVLSSMQRRARAPQSSTFATLGNPGIRRASLPLQRSDVGDHSPQLLSLSLTPAALAGLPLGSGECTPVGVVQGHQARNQFLSNPPQKKKTTCRNACECCARLCAALHQMPDQAATPTDKRRWWSCVAGTRPGSSIKSSLTTSEFKRMVCSVHAHVSTPGAHGKMIRSSPL